MEMGRHPRAGGGGHDAHGSHVARLYSRTGEDISKSFPDLLEALRLPAAIDGELLILREGRVQPFNVLQQRLNRKAVTPKLMAEFPAHLRAYDLLVGRTTRTCAHAPSPSGARGSRPSSAASTTRASIFRRSCAFDTWERVDRGARRSGRGRRRE